MEMNLKQFKYVLVVAHEGSFSKAADVLNVSQPSLSQYIKKIERQLDIELFDRTNGNCRLTDAGKVYVDTARQVLDLERQMLSRFTDLRENKTGTVTVGTTPFRSASMMPDIVLKFRKKYPGIHVVVVEQGNEELKEAAERGEFDICIVNLPVDQKIFDFEIIMEEEFVIAVPKDSDFDRLLRTNALKNSERKYPTVEPKLLNRQEFVMVTQVQVMQKTMNDLCRNYELELKNAAVVKSLEAQLQMVDAGVGAALLPTGIIKSGRGESRISYYSLSEELPKRSVAVVFRKDKYLSKVIIDLINAIKEIDW